jgi:hypothetical protein
LLRDVDAEFLQLPGDVVVARLLTGFELGGQTADLVPRESCVSSGAQQLLATVRVLDGRLNLRPESAEELEGTLTVQVLADEPQHVAMRRPAIRGAQVQAKERNRESVVVLLIFLEVVEKGSEVVPEAQHPGGLYFIEMLRRHRGPRLVAVLQPLLRSLDLLSQRHELITNVRGHDAGGGEDPSLAPFLLRF